MNCFVLIRSESSFVRSHGNSYCDLLKLSKQIVILFWSTMNVATRKRIINLNSARDQLLNVAGNVSTGTDTSSYSAVGGRQSDFRCRDEFHGKNWTSRGNCVNNGCEVATMIIFQISQAVLSVVNDGTKDGLCSAEGLFGNLLNVIVSYMRKHGVG